MNSRLGFYFNVSQAWKGGFLGLSGVWWVIGLPIGIFFFLNFYFKIPVFVLSFLFKPGLEGWVFGSLRVSVGYCFTHGDYLLSKLLL